MALIHHCCFHKKASNLNRKEIAAVQKFPPGSCILEWPQSIPTISKTALLSSKKRRTKGKKEKEPNNARAYSK